MLYRFNEMVNLILNRMSDDDAQKKLKEYIYDDSVGYSEKMELYLICIEKKMYETAELIFAAADIGRYGAFCWFTGLYDAEKRDMIRQHIRNERRYLMSLELKYNIRKMYHLMRNDCRDIIGEIIDMTLLFGKTSGTDEISGLMAVAVRNRDIEALKLFLDKGMCMNEEDIEYLKKIDEEYFAAFVLPELEKYGRKSDA